MLPDCIKFKSVREAANGGVIVECISKTDSELLKKIAKKKLGNDYIVSTPDCKLPMVKMCGISTSYESDKLVTLLKSHNKSIFEDMEIVQKFSLSRSNIFGVKLLIHLSSFKNVMRSKEVRLGWDICPVYEVFSILRCYNCNGFDHIALQYTGDSNCSKCSGKHKIIDYVSNILKCINCVNAAKALNLEIDSNHSAWSDNCQVFLE